jgi:hypothetical protein
MQSLAIVKERYAQARCWERRALLKLIQQAGTA